MPFFQLTKHVLSFVFTKHALIFVFTKHVLIFVLAVAVYTNCSIYFLFIFFFLPGGDTLPEGFFFLILRH